MQREPHGPASVAPRPGAPVIFSAAEMWQLHDQVKTTNRRVHLTTANFAIKFVRKAVTDRSGQPTCLSIDISNKPRWMVPAFRYFPRPAGGKGGQKGEVAFDELRELDWRIVAAQLPPAALHALFGPRSGGANDGITKVSFEVVGEEGHWWSRPHAVNFDLVFWTGERRVHVHPEANKPGCPWKEFALQEAFASASGSATQHSLGERLGPGATGFLHGGSEDTAFLASMARRAELDAGVTWWPEPVWQQLQASPHAIRCAHSV